MKLSIFVAGIRPQNWLALYNSIPNATSLPKEEYELVIVSPYDLPPELQDASNVRLIKDWGCPTRCYQLGLLHSEGEYVVWGADDGTFCPTLAIDKAFDSIPSHKGVVMMKYMEGNIKQMRNPKWWSMGFHKTLARAPHIPNHYLLIMLGLVRRDYLMEIGGWDCNIEHVGLSCPDLSIRLQNDGATVIVGEKLMNVSLCKGKTGDHGPIVDAHNSDKAVFSQIYHYESGAGRSRIDFDNWKQAPSVWPRRFGGVKTGPGYTE